MLKAVMVTVLTGAILAAATPRVANAAAPTIDGIRCDAAEGAVFHIHQHLAIFDHGKPVAIPGDIGRPLLGDCFYWIHTHTPDGLIHVESPVYRTFTLGNFFDVWGEPLTSTAVGPARIKPGQLRVFVDGRPYRGDPRVIPLAQHTVIGIEAGPPYHAPAAFTDWQGQ
ncbi:MAG: hypothetical protein ACREM8_01970 [Vulcanimicrobiaceae bacterium]